MTTVDPEAEGGVASFVRAIRLHFTVPVDFLLVGSRPGRRIGRVASLMRLLSDTRLFWRAVRSGRYHLVHLNPSLEEKALLRDGVLMILARAARVPIVVFMHGWVPECEAKLRHWVPGKLFTLTFLRAEHFIVLASSFQRTLEQWGRRGPITVMGTAVEDAVLDAAPGQPQPPWKPFNVLFLARLEESKGVMTALAVHEILRARGRSVELTIAGDGSAAAAVERRIKEAVIDGVRLIGYVQGAIKLAALRTADVYLFPTEYGEGLPISILEAMAMQLPVVTRPVGGIADFFVDGEMGFVSDSVDPSVFADLVERLIDDGQLRERIGTRNRVLIQECFTGQHVAAKLEMIYNLTVPP
jgi:glycosyltransferase involved in cell wall biosynthesis